MSSPGHSSVDSLVPVLAALDALIERAVAVANAAYDGAGAHDAFRGLHIPPEAVGQLLARGPGGAIYDGQCSAAVAELARAATDHGGLTRLSEEFDLGDFDVCALLLALAPEVDLRYERLFGYLQDDVTRKRPTIDLALSLLAASWADKVSLRARFASTAPLIRHGLVRLVADPQSESTPWPARYLVPDSQIARFVLGQPGLDSSLTEVAALALPSDLAGREPAPWWGEAWRGLLASAAAARSDGRRWRVYLRDPRSNGGRRMIETLAAELSLHLLAIDGARLPHARAEFAWLVERALREARLGRALLAFFEIDAALGSESVERREALHAALENNDGLVALVGAGLWVPSMHHMTGVITLEVPEPGAAARAMLWRSALARHGLTASDEALTAVADRFRLTPTQIGEAAAQAAGQARLGGAGGAGGRDELAGASLLSAARVQGDHALDRLAHKVEAKHDWSDLVLPDEAVAQLRELCQRVTHRRQVMDGWGFERKLALGKGVIALFAGPSGTGKTMAAGILARGLGLDLYKIDLSGVVSKYIGETEKNLDRIFAAAEGANAILFFDEADALFGKRSEVRDSHDRYANLEISYLLQRMEEYDGIAILATNLPRNLDNAFVRRMAHTIYFPFPDEAGRTRIWQTVWPAEAPVSGEVDFGRLARDFRISGGHIRNAALAAAFLAAADGQVVTPACLIHALRREMQKMGQDG